MPEPSVSSSFLSVSPSGNDAPKKVITSRFINDWAREQQASLPGFLATDSIPSTPTAGAGVFGGILSASASYASLAPSSVTVRPETRPQSVTNPTMGAVTVTAKAAEQPAGKSAAPVTPLSAKQHPKIPAPYEPTTRIEQRLLLDRERNMILSGEGETQVQRLLRSTAQRLIPEYNHVMRSNNPAVASLVRVMARHRAGADREIQERSQEQGEYTESNQVPVVATPDMPPFFAQALSSRVAASYY
jgi:hypothetical protein